ncbi:MAG: tyrosine-type recombinase/integrase [Dehalococcoidia bacterium]|jgi:integrase/recombinase XerD
MKTSVLELGNLIQGFKLSCQTEGLSPKTTEWYTSFLLRFLGFLDQNELPAQLNHIEKIHIRQFILYLQQEARTPYKTKPLSGATVQGYVRALKAFFAWAEREEYIPTNVMTKIPIPKAEIRVINTFSETQVQSLFNLCLSSNGNSIRNTLILLLLLDCGLRVSELTGIQLDDINLEEGIIKIRKAKGNKERYVPVGNIAQKFLWKYINTSRPKPLTPHITNLLLNDKGLPLTKNGVQQMLRRYSKKAGIKGTRCSPHTCRHTFARNYLMNGGDIFSLQKILGHSSLASVRIYLNLFSADIKKQHRQFSPVDNMAGNKSFYPLLRTSAKK